jgi:hypothetical protein
MLRGRGGGERIGQTERLLEMRHGLIVCGPPQRPLARLAPPLDRRFRQAGIEIMMGEGLWLSVAQLRKALV